MYPVRYGGQKPMKMLDLSWYFDRLTHPTGFGWYFARKCILEAIVESPRNHIHLLFAG
jgi:hypothetical protein